MSAELKNTVAALQTKVAYLEATLAQMMEKAAKKQAKKAAKFINRATLSLPQSENEGDATDATDTTPSTPKKKKAKKVRDPDAPKKAPNAWIVFTMRVDALLKEHGVAGKAVENKQFASALKTKKPYDEWADEEILTEKASWTKPEVSKQSQAKSDAEAASTGAESGSKPKKGRGPSKKTKKNEEVVAEVP